MPLLCGVYTPILAFTPNNRGPEIRCRSKNRSLHLTRAGYAYAEVVGLDRDLWSNN